MTTFKVGRIRKTNSRKIDVIRNVTCGKRGMIEKQSPLPNIYRPLFDSETSSEKIAANQIYCFISKFSVCKSFKALMMIRYSCQWLPSSVTSVPLLVQRTKNGIGVKISWRMEGEKKRSLSFSFPSSPASFLFLPPPHASHWHTQAYSVERGWSLVLY